MNLEEIFTRYIKGNRINKKFAANLIGVSNSKLNAIFKGKRKMRADELIAFCEYYGIDLNFLKLMGNIIKNEKNNGVF